MTLRTTSRSQALLLCACLLAASPIFAQAPATPAPSQAPASPTPSPTSEATPAKETGTSSGYVARPSGSPSKLGYNSVNVTEPYIALTFDDGPSATLTPKLLDILKARNIKATFFVVGENAAQYPDILKRAVAEGHEIGNHSWNHPNLAKMSQEAVRSQVERTQEAISKATGITPHILRPPYGSITQSEKTWLHDSMGFNIIMWSVDPLDWKDRNSAIVTRRILAETRPGSIVLSHDIHATTVEAMPNVIDSLLAKGFKFKTVSELIAMDQPRVSTPEPTPRTTKKTRKSK